VENLSIDAAVARVPQGPGLGVEVDEERIRAESMELSFT
jgi:muconate cycloisomerase